MVENFTEYRWLERMRYHNGLAWDFLRPHKIGAKAGHPSCNEDDATVEKCEMPIPSSTCHCSTCGKEIARQRYVAETEGQESLEVEDSLLISFLEAALATIVICGFQDSLLFMFRPRMLILLTGETGKPSKRVGMFGGVFEREI